MTSWNSVRVVCLLASGVVGCRTGSGASTDGNTNFICHYDAECAARAEGPVCVAGRCRAEADASAPFAGGGAAGARGAGGRGGVDAGGDGPPPNGGGAPATGEAGAVDAGGDAHVPCDLTGEWALKVTAPVTFGDGAALVSATGEITQWAALHVYHYAAIDLMATIGTCGLALPSYHATPALLGEWYGMIFPDGAVEGAPGDAVFAPFLLPAARFDSVTSVLLFGLTSSASVPSLQPWPADPAGLTPASGFTVVDLDHDGAPGLTAVMKSGAVPEDPQSVYANAPVAVSASPNVIRADRLSYVIRILESFSGTADSCSSIGGTSQFRIETHVVGCRLTTGEACSPDEASVADATRPLYLQDPARAATFVAKRLSGGSACADVRALVP